MKRKLLTFGVAGLVVLLVASVCLAEIEFSVDGWFRARSHLVMNPDLVKGGPERSYTDQRLILNPVLKISDAIHVKARIRALDYIWGHNTVPGLTWPEMIDETETATNQGEGGSNNFQWDRAWVHIFLGKYGSLQIGRQKTDLYYNYAIAEDDTYPRYHYITPVFHPGGPDNNLLFGIFYDKRSEGDVDLVADVIVAPPAGIGIRANDSFTYSPWVHFWNPNLTAGGGIFIWDWAGIGPAGESSNWIQFYGMIYAKIRPVEIKGEFDYLTGKAIGGWDDVEHAFSFFVDASVPVEASAYIDRAAVVVALFQGAKEPKAGVAYGSLPANEDWMDDWKIDIILWDQIVGGISNAWIIRPKIDFVVPDTKWGGYLSACMSFADQEAQYNPGPLPLTTGTEKSIGTELDLAINYTLGPRQTIEAVVGIFMPGKYFDEANQDTSFGAALKTHIKF